MAPKDRNYRGLRLDRFQREAVEAIEEGQSVIVSAPTGTGKTLIADYLIDTILEQAGEVIYTSPIKALSNQKYRQYVKLFGEERVGLVTGDLVIRRDAPLRIMTTEILRNILLEGKQRDQRADEEIEDVHEPAAELLEALSRLKAVIIDEIHFLDDPDRGTVWEELLIYLPRDVQIVGLSATLSNLDEFAGWLSAVRQTPMKIVYEPKRTVPLRFFMMNREVGRVPVERYEQEYKRWARQGGAKKRQSQDGDHGGRGRRGGRGGRGGGRGGGSETTRHVHVIESLHDQSYPALYFIFSRAMVEKLAADLVKSRVAGSFTDVPFRRKIERKLARFDAENPDVLTKRLREMYLKGIAFHHAGLHVLLKSLVEELYEEGLVRVLYCTSTFALGINMPARTVIFDSLTKFNGQTFGPLTVREFMQMAGRAGRRGIDKEGDIVIRQDFSDYEEVEELLEQLLAGKSEPVRSSFNLSFHAVVNLLARFSPEDIRALLERSFKAYRSREELAQVEAQIALVEPNLDAASHQLSRPKGGQRVYDTFKRLERTFWSLKRRRAELMRPVLWEDFVRKLEFLRAHHYIDQNNDLCATANILRHLKIEEVFLTELIARGLLEGCTAQEIYGIMCGLVQTLPRRAKVRPGEEKWVEIAGGLLEIYQSDVVQGAAILIDSEAIFTPALMPLGERWAKGESLEALMKEISSPTDLSGDLVGALRRAKDLVSQVRYIYRDDELRRKELAQVIRDVTRDEVQVVG